MAQQRLQLGSGQPPAYSFWAGATREELAARIQARRHQQAVPTDKDTAYDPMLAATADLSRRLTLLKVRADLRRRLR